ncbi:MAG: putative zinc-binding metallopeptidase [Sphingobacterium sp.]|jgi:substrate import-associated zinc metallohydrolase lipoprotein|nr:putative zinc-binding metallopeptidase [Sphingobacterium sp.]
MKKLLYIALAFCFFACSKEEKLPTEPIVALGGYDFKTTATDQYIYDNFTYPYNIEIKYRWDPAEVNLTKSIAAVKEEKVLDMVKTISMGWIGPYKKIAGDNFLRTYNFSKFYLAGSWEYNTDGTIILGTAEGGVKIVLLGTNDIDTKNRENIQSYLYTIHHEFAHIIHQTRFFPQEWRSIPGNSGWYTSTWKNTSTPEAQAQGFVRNYAKSNMNEDFVETVAFLLVRGQEQYDLLKTNNPSAASVFNQKEAIVVNYYKEVLQLDFRKLQAEVQTALVGITNM